MNTPVALIRKVVDQHKLTVIEAWDTAERCRLYYYEVHGSESLHDHIDDLVKMLRGPFVIKATIKVKERGGRKTAAQAEYKWTVMGEGNSTPAEAAAVPMSGVPSSITDELIQLRVDAAVRAKLDAEGDDDDDDQDDQDDEPLGRLVTLFEAMLSKNAAPASPPVAAPVAGAASPDPAQRGHPSALTKDRMADVLTAIRNLHASDPAQFEQYEQMLLSTYGGARKTG